MKIPNRKPDRSIRITYVTQRHEASLWERSDHWVASYRVKDGRKIVVALSKTNFPKWTFDLEREFRECIIGKLFDEYGTTIQNP